MSERRRLDLSEVDDWLGEMFFRGGDVYGTAAQRGERTGGPNWRRAGNIMLRVFPDAVVNTGHTHRLGRTFHRSQFTVPVDVRGEYGEYVVSLRNNNAEDYPRNPGHDFGDDPDESEDKEDSEVPLDGHEEAYRVRVRREFRILAQLAREASLPFRVPRPVALLLDGDAPLLVVTHVAGDPIGDDALHVVASVAAGLHQLDIDAPGPATRRECALVEIQGLESEHSYGVGGPHDSVVRDAIAFAKSLLPPADPSRFVHGSLALGREPHVMLTARGNDPRPGVIAFENAARGDPAQELASLLRGMKTPLDAAAVARFLDDYARAGGAPIEPSDLDVYEAISLAWRLRMTSEPNPPQIERIVALLKRA